ncbi:MAG: hypothetical protein Q4D14_03210 [Bacteroidales bacterium]|nr:hypothetical protein [Bacteroidales bacterium]
MSTITSLKRNALLPLSYIKYLPMQFAPTFYEKAAVLFNNCSEATLLDSITRFDGIAQAFVADMEQEAVSLSEEVTAEFQRIRRLWGGVKHLFKAYSTSYNTANATLANKALALYDKLEETTIKRTNASVVLLSLVNSISDSWTTAELAGTFLEPWLSEITAAANAYASVYQRRVEHSAQRIYFVDRREACYEAFELVYMGLYVYAKNSGDQTALDLFAEVNELIMTYTAVTKARSTRINRRNRQVQETFEDGIDNNSDAKVEVVSVERDDDAENNVDNVVAISNLCEIKDDVDVVENLQPD